MSAPKHKPHHQPHQGSKRAGDEWDSMGAQAHRLDADYDSYDEGSEDDEVSGVGSGWGAACHVHLHSTPPKPFQVPFLV